MQIFCSNIRDLNKVQMFIFPELIQYSFLFLLFSSRSKSMKYELVANPSISVRLYIEVPGKREMTPLVIAFIPYNPSLCARDTSATGPAFIRKVKKNWNIFLLKYKGPLPLLLSQLLQ